MKAPISKSKKVGLPISLKLADLFKLKACLSLNCFCAQRAARYTHVPLKDIFAVSIISEDTPTLCPSDHNVIRRVRARYKAGGPARQRQAQTVSSSQAE